MLGMWVFEVSEAISRARGPISLMALTYLLAVLTGMGMVGAQNKFALDYRDKLISDATAHSRVLKSQNSGHHLRATLLDFAGNLGLGAVPETIAGLSVVFPFPMAAFRGWVGGVVSVDQRHHSRLTEFREAIYYLVVMVLQLIPYSLAGGAGVRLGLRCYSTWGRSGVRRWWFLPRDAALDVLWIYSLVVPLFLVASLVEFLAG